MWFLLMWRWSVHVIGGGGQQPAEAMGRRLWTSGGLLVLTIDGCAEAAASVAAHGASMSTLHTAIDGAAVACSSKERGWPRRPTVAKQRQPLVSA